VSETPPEDIEILNSYTPPGLYKFLDLAIKRGDVTQATGTALRVGAKKVLDVEDDDTVDLRKIDLDDLLRRFRTLTRMDLSEKTQGTYEDRVRKAIEMYVKYLNGDSSWRPATRAPRQATKKSAPAKSTTSTTPLVEETPETDTGSTPPPPPTKVRMVTIPVPLRRDGTQAELKIPADFTGKEASRVAKVIEAMALDEQLAITTGEATE
jgi:hypothetical protein